MNTNFALFTGLVLALAWVASPCWAATQKPVAEAQAQGISSITPAITPQIFPSDQKRAVPNNSAPPARLAPLHRLPALPASTEGNIRRVTVGKDMGKVVALTFDLCELAVNTTGYDAPLIAFLREQKLPATLFLGGKWMRTHSERTLELLADSLFEIGTHGWAHGNFGIMSQSAMQRELDWTNAQYELLHEELLRRKGPLPHVRQSSPLFRLPYGRCSDAALRLLAQSGLQVIQWDVEGETAPDNTKAGLEKGVAARVKPGSIMLYHANLVPKGSLAVLQRTVAVLREQGYRFVTVSQLLEMGTPQRTRKGYFSVPGDNVQYDTMFGVDGTGIKR